MQKVSNNEIFNNWLAYWQAAVTIKEPIKLPYSQIGHIIYAGLRNKRGKLCSVPGTYK